MIMNMRLLIVVIIAILHSSFHVDANGQNDTIAGIVDNDECNLYERPVVKDGWDDNELHSLIQKCYGRTINCPEPYNIPIGCWNTEFVTDTGGAFALLEDFNEPIGTWNVSRITEMSGMFYQAHSFNQPLGAWDVGKVTRMDEMFCEAHSFNQPLEAWDVGNVTDMYRMFDGSGASPSFVNFTQWFRMFNGTSSFNQPLEAWDVGKVTDMFAMFFGASSFNQPLETWDVGKVTNMEWMLDGASSFNQPCKLNQTIEEWYPCRESLRTDPGLESSGTDTYRESFGIIQFIRPRMLLTTVFVLVFLLV